MAQRQMTVPAVDAPIEVQAQFTQWLQSRKIVFGRLTNGVWMIETTNEGLVAADPGDVVHWDDGVVTVTGP